MKEKERGVMWSSTTSPYFSFCSGCAKIGISGKYSFLFLSLVAQLPFPYPRPKFLAYLSSFQKVCCGQDPGDHLCQRRCDDAAGPRKRRSSQRRFKRCGRETIGEQNGDAHAKRARQDPRLHQAGYQRCRRIGADTGAP